MSRQQQGKDYEHDLCTEIALKTDGTLLPIPAGYSGNHTYALDQRIDAPDIMIDDGQAVHCIELKNKGRGKDAVSFMYDEEERSKDDIYGLVNFCKLYPRPCYPYLGVRFSNRQLILTKLFVDAKNKQKLLKTAELHCPVESKITRADNFRVYKPDTDEWPSASKGSDSQHILDTIRFNL